MHCSRQTRAICGQYLLGFNTRRSEKPGYPLHECLTFVSSFKRSRRVSSSAFALSTSLRTFATFTPEQRGKQGTEQNDGKEGRTDGRTDRFLQAADCHEKNGTFTGKKKRKEKSHDKKRMLTKEADHHRRKGIITQEKGLSKKKRDYHANNMVDCHQKVQK